MATLDTYSQKIQTLLHKYASQIKTDGEIETQLLFDTQHHHYQLLEVGWEAYDRIYGFSMPNVFQLAPTLLSENTATLAH